jgi:hypothetical protein
MPDTILKTIGLTNIFLRWMGTVSNQLDVSKLGNITQKYREIIVLIWIPQYQSLGKMQEPTLTRL